MDESEGDTDASETTGTTNAVDVVVNVGRKVVVHHVGDIWDTFIGVKKDTKL